MTDNTALPIDDALTPPHYTAPPERPTEGNLAKHAWDELNRAGLFTEDGDFYGGMVGCAVMDLVKTFSEQGHSGMSAAITLDLFGKVANFKPLTSLTNNPDEWFFHGPEMSGFPDGLWQNTRQSDAFSHDGGKTYYEVGKPEEIFLSGNFPLRKF